MRVGKVYAHGRHAISQAQEFAPHAVLKVFTDARGAEVAQISLHKLLRSYEDFADQLAPKNDTLLVLLAGLEDPHNVGAIIRSAAAFGAAAILMPKENQAPISDTVLKVSAGMAFRVPLVTFEGYQQTLSDLRRQGFSVVALDHKSEESISQATFNTPTVLVVGNEGAGIPGAVRPLVTQSLSIPMDERAESLNVAAATAVALYVWRSKR